MDKQIIFCERKESGVSNMPAIQLACEGFPIGKRLMVTVQLKSNRSDRQNRYFHATVKIFGDALGYTPEEAKSIIKMKFLKREKVSEVTGEIHEYILETHKLSKEDFADFMNQFIIWSAQMGIIIPAPNENIEMNFGD